MLCNSEIKHYVTLKNNCRKLGSSIVDDQFFGGLNDTFVISATENATPNAKDQLRKTLQKMHSVLTIKTHDSE